MDVVRRFGECIRFFMTCAGLLKLIIQLCIWHHRVECILISNTCEASFKTIKHINLFPTTKSRNLCVGFFSKRLELLLERYRLWLTEDAHKGDACKWSRRIAPPLLPLSYTRSHPSQPMDSDLILSSSHVNYSHQNLSFRTPSSWTSSTIIITLCLLDLAMVSQLSFSPLRVVLPLSLLPSNYNIYEEFRRRRTEFELWFLVWILVWIPSSNTPFTG